MHKECGLHNHDRHQKSCCFNDEHCACHLPKTDKKSQKATFVILSVSLVSAVLSYVFFKLELYSDTVFAFLDIGWIAILLCGLPIYKEAFLSLKEKKIVSSLLISLALTASIVMGFVSIFLEGFSSHENYFFVAAEIAFLMALGEYIEDLTSSKSRSAIQSLIALTPSMATLKTNKGYTEKAVSEIEIGDIVLVRPNEKIPLDGVVFSGKSSINQSTLTGESLPREVEEGGEVYSSTLNLTHPIEVKVTKKSHESVISRLIEYYKNAIKNKAPIARIVDKIASRLVPLALVTALIVFAITAGSISVTEGLARGMAILVVFCPCGLALATPTAISATIGNASRRGILIKNGATLEVLSKIDTIAFDKTGTLTTGQIEVDEVTSFNMTKEELLSLAASAEAQSEHPIAKAIVAFYGKAPKTPQKTLIKTGVGVEAVIDGKKVELVKASQAAQFEDYIQNEEFFQGHKSVVAIAVDGRLEGAITLKDTIKEKAHDTIKSLKQMNYQTVLITGDNQYAAKETAENLDFDKYHYDKMPLEKAELVLGLRKSGKRVLMVGDGVNDAPALAQSDASISMGSIGSEAAIEAGDISLSNDDISKIPSFMTLAKRGVKTIHINIFLSLFINAVTVALSAAGLLSAVWGALLHNVSSVLVALNSALLLTTKK